MHNEALKTGRNMAADWDARAEDNALYFIAESYDDADFRASGEREVEQYLLSDVMLPAEATVLEIGCGIGRLLRPMAARCKKVIGFDVSPKMIEMSKQYLADVGNVETYANDGSTLPGVADDSVDYCYSYICFQHIPQKEFIASYLREAYRVLKPGGVFKFQLDGQTWPGRAEDSAETWQGVWYTALEIRQACLDAGYSILYVTGGGTQHLWVLCQKSASARVLGLMASDSWSDHEEQEQRRETLIRHPETITSPPLPAAALSGIRLRVKNPGPLEIAVGSTIALIVEATNFSDCALVSAAPNPVFLSYHWMSADGKKTLVRDGLRTGIFPPLEPGSRRSIRTRVKAPAGAGRYILRVTFVQEDVRWFDARGLNLKLDIPVEIG